MLFDQLERVRSSWEVDLDATGVEQVASGCEGYRPPIFGGLESSSALPLIPLILRCSQLEWAPASEAGMTEGEGMDSRLGALSACLCRDGEGELPVQVRVAGGLGLIEA